ncbi:Protein kinase domain [Dillenia turbinata]|uniref:Protein kinase domain n=1 Tax=Dillenia turbinata TaxID=194707 RepID=A0AAN8ZJD6_9MAGN
MDGEADLPAKNLISSINPDVFPNPSITSSSSSSLSSSSSPPGFLRHVQAAFRRHRPLGTMQSNTIRPRRTIVPQRGVNKSLATNLNTAVETKKPQDVVSLSQDQSVRVPFMQTKNTAVGETQDDPATNLNTALEMKKPQDVVSLSQDQSVRVPFMQTKNTAVGETQDDPSITPPSITGTITDDNYNLFDEQRERNKDPSSPNMSLSNLGSQHPQFDCQKKVQHLSGNNANPQGADDQKATGMDNLSFHLASLALTEMDWDVSNQVEALTVENGEGKQQNVQNLESEFSLRSDGGTSALLAKRATLASDQHHALSNFIQSEPSHPMTHSSVVGSSCATTISVHSTSAPMLSSTTYCSRYYQDGGSRVAIGSMGDDNMYHQVKGDIIPHSNSSAKSVSGISADQAGISVQAQSTSINAQLEVKNWDPSKEQQSSMVAEAENLKEAPQNNDKLTKGENNAGDATDIRSQAPMSTTTSISSGTKTEPSKPEKPEKNVSSKGVSAPRRRNYDPDLFFKVNGKLYQRLGKIGSGGSSEVHKVISSDCTIYALKRIKLKGRDYATAYGFCQEIYYLTRLKGKNNIIQLMDYEVTDKTLLQEVMSGSMSNKDGKVKDDGYIYMVLEYGEIDLAHMLSQKWKEADSTSSTIDDNWLRFYWQQILQAVNTIHEERIVHSDLKPANFLLVRGQLKLIDFGIAKAIMSDTTNIQRDSQVGTLSYMSPEAFMCNESDANGNTIKCGRPSDIWSLGCILYQMVYGRTPFSEYKTFWAKFKVITDRNHQITYGPVSNPWLLDLMKKCLAWDRNERWRIPQLLQHPFLVPPVSEQIPCSPVQSCKLLQLISEASANNQEALKLCFDLQELLSDLLPATTPKLSTPREQCCKLLTQNRRP